jgi:hypothetical protein
MLKGLRNIGVSVLHEMSHFSAHEIATRQGINPSQFKVSGGWVYFFMKRKGLRISTDVTKPTNAKRF